MKPASTDALDIQLMESIGKMKSEIRFDVANDSGLAVSMAAR